MHDTLLMAEEANNSRFIGMEAANMGIPVHVPFTNKMPSLLLSMENIGAIFLSNILAGGESVTHEHIERLRNSTTAQLFICLNVTPTPRFDQLRAEGQIMGADHVIAFDETVPGCPVMPLMDVLARIKAHLLSLNTTS